MHRRSFLRGALAMGCSAAAMPLITHATFASAPWENRLVVVILRGALDGLDLLRPVGDPGFAALRPRIAADPGADLDGFFALHPGLPGLLPLWKAGELGFAQAVATPYRDKRSHFDGQDLLEAGTAPDAPAALRREGWLNRLLQTVPGAQAETAFAVGREAIPILSGKAPAQNWAPDARLELSAQGRRLLEEVYHDDPIFRDAAAEAFELTELAAAMAESGADDSGMAAPAPTPAPAGGPLAEVDRFAAYAAARLREDTRIVALSLAGWDTHRAQIQTIRQPLQRLERLVLALREGLGPVWGQTMLLAMTEFGRTVRENGSQGTDHGTGGAMLMAGGALRGGRVVGKWPGLDEGALYARRDLMPTSDVRAHAAWAMRGLFGVDRAVLERTVFPGLDMGGDPGLLR
ncbi:DUF1501 domain-containing protein [Ruixingdingia sedimenti]|uniref:DUF1501 domain-containing protein n=1 Tax=Ruixingdingia sedimenti TaxID=3073604 RepID=A0ABU1F2S1_9RHOB|nr:DUF1501 domain-containing protein [Xinfangfangia sp. LG-4]MDR5651161.1 DUF1501 domain-containing protein [Xinfangfangia sp. LG-4]